MKIYFKLLIIALFLITVAGCKKQESPLPGNAFLRKGIEYRVVQATTSIYVSTACSSQKLAGTFSIIAASTNPVDTMYLQYYNLPTFSGSSTLSAHNTNCLPYSFITAPDYSYFVDAQAGGILTLTNNTYSFKNIRYYDSSLGEDFTLNISGSY